LTLHRIYCI